MAKITIKSLGAPPSDTHWSYGPDYMHRISKRAARELCGMYPMPDMGCATTVAVATVDFTGQRRLEVQNISGAYYLASCDTPASRWAEVFGVDVTT